MQQLQANVLPIAKVKRMLKLSSDEVNDLSAQGLISLVKNNQDVGIRSVKKHYYLSSILKYGTRTHKISVTFYVSDYREKGKLVSATEQYDSMVRALSLSGIYCSNYFIDTLDSNEYGIRSMLDHLMKRSKQPVKLVIMPFNVFARIDPAWTSNLLSISKEKDIMIMTLEDLERMK